MTQQHSGRSARSVRRILAAAAIALATLPIAAPPAGAAEPPCRPHLRAIANVEPLGLPLVTLQVNNHQVHLLLDTGAERTTLTEAAVRKLGLVTVYRPGQNMQGVGGNVAAGAVRPGRVFAGGMLLRDDTTFAVIPVALPPVGDEPVEGLLGADLLQLFDLDLDIHNHLIRFYDPIICADPELPWARRYSTLRARMSSHAHMVFPIVLDGHALNAFIDTGAQLTTMDADASAAVGVTARMLQDDAQLTMRGVSGDVVVAHEHVYNRITVAGEVLPAPAVMVTPLRLDDAELLFGADFLMRQRVWLSYSSNRLYVERPE